MSRASRRLNVRPRPMPGAVSAASRADLEKERNIRRRAATEYARPVVADHQRRLARATAQRDVNSSVGRGGGVLAGVIDQVQQHLLDRGRVRQHHGAGGRLAAFDDQRHARLLGVCGQSLLGRDRPALPARLARRRPRGGPVSSRA